MTGLQWGLAAAAAVAVAWLGRTSWVAQPTGHGVVGVVTKVAFGRSNRDTIAIALGLGILVAGWVATGLVWLVAQIAGITGLDTAAWAPAGTDAVVLALVALATWDVFAIGLYRSALLRPAFRHIIAAVALPVVVAAGTPLLAQTTVDAVHAVGQVPPPAACAPLDLEGDTIAGFGPDRLTNAQIIVQVGQELGVPERGRWIALATAMQETGLRNIDYGDRDSVGLFQQRPSQGWGSVAQILDPRYSATQFYNRLVKLRGWERLPLWQAAQGVQRSGFPTAYEKWADEAAEVLGAVNNTPCTGS